MTIETNDMAKVHRSALPWQALAKFPGKHTEHFQGTILHGRKLLYFPTLKIPRHLIIKNGTNLLLQSQHLMNILMM